MKLILIKLWDKTAVKVKQTQIKNFTLHKVSFEVTLRPNYKKWLDLRKKIG